MLMYNHEPENCVYIVCTLQKQQQQKKQTIVGWQLFQ